MTQFDTSDATLTLIGGESMSSNSFMEISGSYDFDTSKRNSQIWNCVDY